MRVLLIVPVFSSTLGGTVAVVRDIARELARNHEVTVLTTTARTNLKDMSNIPIEFNQDGYHVVAFPRRLKRSGFNISPSALTKLKEIIQEHDVVHLHSWRQFFDITFFAINKMTQKPYLIQTHGSIPRTRRHRIIKIIYDMTLGNRLMKKAQYVLALNKIEAKQCYGLGAESDKIRIIPNGIDMNSYLRPKKTRSEIMQQLGVDDKGPIILYVGRIHQDKGLSLLASAFQIISSKIKDATLLIIGPDDGYKRKFIELITNLGIKEKVKITGFVQKEEKISALAGSDVFVTPNYEAFPITFLEACACKCPIITTSNDLEWIDDNVGYVTNADPNNYANAIKKVITNDEVRQRMRNNCELMMKRFDISVIASQLIDIYKSAVEHK